MNISVFKNTNSEELIKLSYYATLSALEHFQSIYEKFNEVKTNGENARTSQIMSPLITLAKIIGSDYSEAIEKYSVKSQKAKEYIESQSIEGMVQDALDILKASWFIRKDYRVKRDSSTVTYGKNLEQTFLLENYLFDNRFISFDDNYVYTQLCRAFNRR